MSALHLAANQTEIVGEKNVPASGIFRDVKLGQRSRLILEGVEVTLDDITLDRIGTRSVELINGAALSLGEVSFASLGASIVYRIGPGCSLTLDANLAEPEIIENTTIEFASDGTGSLKFAPFVNPEWRSLPQLQGWKEGDVVTLVQTRPERFRMEAGRIEPIAPAA